MATKVNQVFFYSSVRKTPAPQGQKWSRLLKIIEISHLQTHGQVTLKRNFVKYLLISGHFFSDENIDKLIYKFYGCIPIHFDLF